MINISVDYADNMNAPGAYREQRNDGEDLLQTLTSRLSMERISTFRANSFIDIMNSFLLLNLCYRENRHEQTVNSQKNHYHNPIFNG